MDTPAQPNSLLLPDQENHDPQGPKTITPSASSGTIGLGQASHIGTSLSRPTNTVYGSPTKVTKNNTPIHVFAEKQDTVSSNSSTFEFNLPLHLMRLGIRKKWAFIRLLIYCVPDEQVKLIWNGDRNALDTEYLSSIPDSTMVEYYHHIKSSLQTNFSTSKGFRPILDKGTGYTKYAAREDWHRIEHSIF